MYTEKIRKLVRSTTTKIQVPTAMSSPDTTDHDHEDEQEDPREPSHTHQPHHSAAAMSWCCLACVSTGEMGVIESLGKFSSIASPGALAYSCRARSSYADLCVLAAAPAAPAAGSVRLALTHSPPRAHAAGATVFCWPLSNLAGTVTTRVQQLMVPTTTKTKDNVTITVRCKPAPASTRTHPTRHSHSHIARAHAHPTKRAVQ